MRIFLCVIMIREYYINKITGKYYWHKERQNHKILIPRGGENSG